MKVIAMAVGFFASSLSTLVTANPVNLANPPQCWYAIAESEAPWGCIVYGPTGNVVDAVLCVNPNTLEELTLAQCNAFCALLTARCTAAQKNLEL